MGYKIVERFKKAGQPKVLVYAFATLRPIRHREDWHDIPGLGLSVVCCTVSWMEDSYKHWVFTVDTGFKHLQELIDEAEEIVSFNGLELGDRLLTQAGFHIETTFDLMQQVRKAADQPITGPCKAGYNLLLLAAENLGADCPQVRIKSDSSPTHVRIKSDSCPGLASDLWRRGKKKSAVDLVLNDAILIEKLYKLRTNLSDPIRLGVRLHCDDRVIDWRDVVATLDYFVTERLFNVGLVLRPHWTGAQVYLLRVSIAESLIVSFPVWIALKKNWRKYVGLPFRKPSPYVITSPKAPYKALKEDDRPQDGDIDPIPF